MKVYWALSRSTDKFPYAVTCITENYYSAANAAKSEGAIDKFISAVNKYFRVNETPDVNLLIKTGVKRDCSLEQIPEHYKEITRYSDLLGDEIKT